MGVIFQNFIKQADWNKRAGWEKNLKIITEQGLLVQVYYIRCMKLPNEQSGINEQDEFFWRDSLSEQAKNVRAGWKIILKIVREQGLILGTAEYYTLFTNVRLKPLLYALHDF